MAKQRVIPFELEPIATEFAGVDLGDARREKRLAWMVDRLAEEPARSFPEALVSVSGAEAGYRLLRSRHVSADSILAPHHEATRGRARSCQCVLALHDTTEMRFGGAKHRAGLGPLMNGGEGFYLHAALLASFDDGAEHAVPLGLMAHEIVVRREGKTKRPWRKEYNDPDKESLRWNRVLERVEADMRGEGIGVIHVADREASRYDLLAHLYASGGRFVVRLRRGFLDRAETLREARGRLDRVAQVSARRTIGGRRRARAPREARVAELDYHARTMRLRRPTHVDAALRAELEVNVVEVSEHSAPAGTEPISWLLITTEPLSNEREIERVIDAYRARWLIEEYWKALKTGCAFESRQLEGLNTLEKALAICIPIAWHMLLLRNVARDAPATPAARLLSPLLYELLLAIAPTALNQWGFKLSSSPTAGELLYAIARVGGHLPNNGSPGFITIRRGLDTLYALEAAASPMDAHGL